VFIAMLTGEKRSDEEMAGLAEVYDLIDAEKVVVVTSAMATVEVLNDKANKDVRASFEALFTTPRFVRIDVTAPVAAKARDIRQSLPNGNKLKGEDATFIATAILFGCQALHTFDRDQLRLSGHKCVDGLTIERPHGAQTVMF
jgi:predicted nucleic acid-binding protein